ncbi:MAG: 2-succinyl-5-enolpyruvyl-6-hydroxy-3-cyclohexene-1-carboxylic-acid synthase [Candidatus Hydrogenedentes bacterium]|nr:2-succinyl-5-enolpyruvyl-6-hydroxy-3-cyclohexene-1-carboxylic-acid synthase [Candidatus Hydrogenedentota bacterium]
MIADAPNLNALWAELIIEELFRNAVDTFFLAPGSRCAPLTVAVARHPKVRSVVHHDERGLAYCGVGYARAANRPAAIICTSGTAVANLLPGVVEASYAGLPLILLTADRPPELQDAGANQTIRQPGVFGEFVRWEHTFPCPDRSVPATAVLTTIDQAVYQAHAAPAGPVHLNCMYREPLAPVRSGDDFAEYLAPLTRWQKGTEPYTRYEAPGKAAPENLEPLAEILLNTARGVLVTGQLSKPADCLAVRDLTAALNWPTLPDAASGLRLGPDLAPIVHYYDQMLLAPRVRSLLSSETVLHLGGTVTSKRLSGHLQEFSPHNYVLVSDHPFRQDPSHRVTQRIAMPIAEFCEALSPHLTPDRADSETPPLHEVSRHVGDAIEAYLDARKALYEPAVARLVSRLIPDGHGLFVGNSLPIRDLDMYAAVTPRLVPVFANRGASGIDGNAATIAGIAIGSDRPVTGIIGDLALMHDLSSLALLRKTPVPVTLVVLNNNGGGIFSFLPVADYPDVFEWYFATPHGYTFEHAAGLFGLEYFRPKTPDAFISTYQHCSNGGEASVIEVVTNRDENLRVHRELQEAVRTALDSNPIH